MPDAALRDSRPRTPSEVDSFRPSAARMYDYYLGGSNHLAADREAADALLDAVPQVAEVARQNREFLHRVVEYAVQHGVTQFLDLGSGYASPGGLPEVALAHDPSCRVVAVDIDPAVVAQVQTIVRTSRLSGQVGAVHSDLRDLTAILEHPVTQRLIDFDRPVAILCLAVLHFVPGDLQHRVLAPLRRTAARGSLLALSHATAAAPTPTDAPVPPGRAQSIGVSRPDPSTIVRLIYDCTLTPLTLRTESELRRAIGDLDLVSPGLVPVDRWHPPSSGPETVVPPISSLLAAVAQL
ncbi:SAM-dependent methyltransferase [Cryptosporangium aurantiacum]|uniref:S-adenosyl methyltransferase n=1 Tax=Cryptosporangium aurantiacum TaxID=134849 RepID=A0A1M7PUA8_9ACTN|nr:SAM-dependent methyltransferase [Cryptosporangium aurantiacum]SHN20995.1 S-adenosyl methyltransferase [Cryptosporangium aurantiacum]